MDRDKESLLGRWSRRKREERSNAAGRPAEAKKKEAEAPALPPIDKLDAQSDFAPFMHPKVQDSLRRVALKKLFSDPHFNEPDVFEPFSGDWTGGEPIGAEMLQRLNQARSALMSPEEREARDRGELERDHEEALALDAEWDRRRAAQPEKGDA